MSSRPGVSKAVSELEQLAALVKKERETLLSRWRIQKKDGAIVDTLVDSADRAMYQTKRDSSGYAFAT